ncbi:MAG: hypothetical protein WDM91_23685 [Rhizomicrobium sp.]
MVAIVTGAGLGVVRGSGYVLGSRGQLGTAAFGTTGENVTINAATGNLSITRTDDILDGFGADDTTTRAYNSMAPGTDDNGDHWMIGNGRMITHLTGTVNTAGSTVTRIDWDGSDTLYTYDATRACYVSKQGSGAYDTLAYTASPAKWTWTDGDTQLVETYTVAVNPNDATDAYWAVLTSSRTINGTGNTYGWTGNKLTTFSAGSGEWMHFNYTGNNLTSMSQGLTGGVTVTNVYYTYDGSNRLVTVTTDLSPTDNAIADGNVVAISYTYDGSSDRVASITQWAGPAVTGTVSGLLAIGYDGSGRVASYTQTLATGVTATTTLSYDAVNHATTITDPRGNATKMTYDASGQLTRVDYPGGAEYVTFTYDTDGNVLTATDGLGNVTTYAYDANGNMTLKRDATGFTTIWTYSATDQVLTESVYAGRDTDGAGPNQPTLPSTTRYVYDSYGNLHYAVSGQGEVKEYRWNPSYNFLMGTNVYRDQVYDVSALAANVSIAESALISWTAGLPDKTTVDRVDYQTDFRGNVWTERAFTTNAADGTGSTGKPWEGTTCTFDQYGNLLSRQVYGKTAETFVYDGLNRMTSSVDLLGQTTTYAFNDAAGTTTVTLANGLQTTSTYNMAGWLISTQQTATGMTSSTVGYAYDADGNLRMVTDALGNKSYFLYDALGRKVADIAADGSIVEYRYNAADLLTTTIRYATRLTSGALASLVDGSGKPATVTLASILPAASAADGWEWRVYDASDRMIETIDSDGDATVYGLDGLGNIAGQSSFANAISAVTIAGDKLAPPTAIQSPTSDATRDNTVRAWFDNDGREIGTLDPDGYLTQYFYNGAGETIETIRYADPAVYNASFATVLASVVPDGTKDINTRYFYDNRGELKYTLDTNLMPTEYDYDNYGNLIATYTYGAAINTTATYSAAYIAAQITSLGLMTNAKTQGSWEIYDAANRLIETIDAAGDVTVFTYDAVSNLISTQVYYNKLSSGALSGFKTTPPTTLQLPTADSRDQLTRNFYDPAGRLIGTLDADGYLTAYLYNAAGQKTDVVVYSDPAVWNASFATTLASATPSATNDVHTRYFYDADGRLQYTLDSKLVPTEYVYDAQGNLVHVTQYDGAIASTATYTNAYIAGRIVTQSLATQPGTRTTWNVYDPVGRLAYTIDAAGDVTSNTYDAIGHLIKQVRFATARTTTSDPSQGTMDTWVGTNANAADRTTRFFYDAAGQLAYEVDALGYVTRHTYDFAGRVVSDVRYADSYAGSISDATTNMATVLPGSLPGTAVQTNYSYDPLGRLTDSFDGQGYDTHYVYDALGRVTSKTVAYGTADAATTNYTYDILGRLTGTTDPAGGVSSCTYDGQGNVLTETDANGNVTSYTRDALGQVTTATTATAVTHYQYDAFGNVVMATDGLGNKSYSFYDNMDRLVATLDEEGYATQITYDSFGDAVSRISYATKVTATITPGVLPSFTTNAADITTYSFYDRLGRSVLAVDGEQYATQTSYTAFGEVDWVDHYGTKLSGTITPGTLPVPVPSLPIDEKTDFTYDKLGRDTQTQDAESHSDYYVYDAFGNQTQTTNRLGGVTNRVYDKRGLLTSETLQTEAAVDSTGTTVATSVTNSYTYDGRGNRITMVEASNIAAEQRTTTYTYDLADRLTKTQGTAVDVYSYTTNWADTGNVASYTSYKYDANGNVIEQDDASGARTLFYYDSANRRIAQLGALGTLSTWSYDANGNLTGERVYGDTFTLPALPGGAAPTTASTNYRETLYGYYKNNLLKTTTVASVLTWQNGQVGSPITASVVVTNAYDAFGNLIMQTDGRSNNSWFFYDKRGYKTAQVDQAHFLTTYALNADGNVLTERRYFLAVTAPSSSPPATTAPAGSNNAADRITNFVYDRMGRRTSEERLNVEVSTIDASTLARTTTTTSSIVYYTYNALGEVTQKTEADNVSGVYADYTTYTYDAYGRQTAITAAPFVDSTGTSVTPTTQMYYDGLNNLTRSVQNGSRVTKYTYDHAGRQSTMTDASGFTRTYHYDVDGRMLVSQYARAAWDGSSTTEADLFHYDALGRLDFQEKGTLSGGAWVTTGSDKQTLQYNAWGEVVGKGVNGLTQESFTYDNAGRVTRSTAGDGTVKFYLYDGNGDQTALITSDGTALAGGYSWSTITQAQVLSLLTSAGTANIGSVNVAGMVLTFTTYDARDMALSTVAPFRKLSAAGAAVTITQSQTYNAFGEIWTQTDANGHVTTYTYNTMGKVIATALPAVTWTDETGLVHSAASPTTHAYYDASGRVVATVDANGNESTRLLLSGTGHNGDDALTVKEHDPDASVWISSYDVNRDLKAKSTNGVDSSGSETFAYDAMDRLIEDDHPTRAANSVGNGAAAGSSQQLVDKYSYDGLGQRIKHEADSLTKVIATGVTTTAAVTDTTEYDLQGRVKKTTDAGGHVTTYGYSWSAAIATTGLGTFGGWTKTTVNVAGLTETESLDYFGRTVAKTDFGGNSFASSFDLAGRLAAEGGDGASYTYYNTGQVATETSASAYSFEDVAGTGGDPGYRVYYTDWTGESFAYDANGNRTRETTTGYHNVDNDSGEAGLPKYQPGLRTTTAEDATVTWDALNRMTNFSDTGANLALPPTTIAWEYDLNSNIRYMTASYQAADGSGTTAQTYWYKYDAMNRFVTTKGTLTGARGSGSITVGTGSVITYDAAGHRATVTDASSAEVYSYTADGYLAQVTIGGVLRAKYALDATGRALAYSEYNAAGTSVVYSRTAVYDAVSNVTSDSVTTVRTDGTYVAASTYSYGTPVYHAGTFSYSFDGAYQGVVSQIVTTNTKNGSAQPTSEADYFYDWRDSAVEGTESYTANTAVSAPVANYSGYNYGLGGRLQSVVIDDGHPRTITFGTNIEGQILSRAENDNVSGTVDQYERHFYFDGMALGDVSNNGTSDTDYAASIAAHIAVPGSGNLRGGATVAMPYADFDQSYDPVNGITYAGAPSHYTAQDGDTLAGIAAMVWGDASLWYLIADANGLSSPSDSLTAGTDLILPNKVVNLHNNASTFKVYDPNEAIGDTAPTVPKQPKHDNGCGVLGQILLAVIAIAVTVVTAGAAVAALGPVGMTLGEGIGAFFGVAGAAATTIGTAGFVAIGAGAAALGSIVSQGVGLATGIQDSFNWGAVGLAAIGGGISGGLGANGGLLGEGGILGSTGDYIADAALQGAAVSAATQGIGVATGLQNSFDWTGVVAAGIGAAAGTYVGHLLTNSFSTGGSLNLGGAAANLSATRFLSGMAADIANAATRTLINGSDFGDNIIAALPDTIGQTIGNLVAGGIQGSGQPASTDPLPGESDGDYLNRMAELHAATAGDISGDVQFAGPGAAPPKQDEGFFGWLGDEISSGWHALVQGGETLINDVTEAVGIGDVFTPASSGNGTSPTPGVETVTVTAPKYNPNEVHLWSFSEFMNIVTRPANYDRPYSAVGGPPNSHNSVAYFYPDGRMEVRTGGTLAWRDNNPGNLRHAPDAIGTNSVYSAAAANHVAPMAIFPDVQAGLDAQEHLLFGPSYRNLSIADAMTKYAPPTDSNPTDVMIAKLSAAAGVPSTTIMSALTPDQRMAFMAQEQAIEQSRPGTVEIFYWGLPDPKY